MDTPLIDMSGADFKIFVALNLKTWPNGDVVTRNQWLIY
jgi:hypothetical protein